MDTSIWWDFHENRVDRFRPLGEWAFELLKKIIREKDIVLYSDLVVEELLHYFSMEKINKMFSIVADKGLLEEVDISQEQRREAGILCNRLKIPFSDCIYAILARDNLAIMVARDHHFELLAEITEFKKPEELI